MEAIIVVATSLALAAITKGIHTLATHNFPREGIALIVIIVLVFGVIISGGYISLRLDVSPQRIIEITQQETKYLRGFPFLKIELPALALTATVLVVIVLASIIMWKYGLLQRLNKLTAKKLHS